MKPARRGIVLFQLLAPLAFLLILLGLLLPAVQKVRLAAARMQSSNNLKQIGLAMHNYESTFNKLPPGVDANHFSALTHILPYIEQDNLFKKIDLTKKVDHDDNKGWAAMRIKIFMSPLDPIMQPDEKFGSTNYFLNAGTKASLEDNDGVAYRDSALKLTDITDGTSNTVMASESLKGDGGTKAVTVRRQHVKLNAKALKGIKDTAGVKDFEDDKNIAGNRGASWMDGRFLQATMNARREFNDKRPDVDCGGEGGLAGLRSSSGINNVLLCDGSVRGVVPALTHKTWMAACTRAGGEVLGDDW